MARSLSEKIFLKLQKAIIAGEYSPGEKLPTERSLADRFGVSRFAVREAVAKLAQLGLVNTRAQSGTYITDYNTEGSLDLLIHIMRTRGELDQDSLKSLTDFRILTECHAVTLATNRATDQEIEYLKSLIEEEEKQAGSPRKLAQINFNLHNEIMRLSGNIVFQLIFNSFKPLLGFYLDKYYSLPDVIPRALALNRKLVEAIADRDKKGAANYMEKTLKFAQEQVLAAATLSK